jgi:hypothetical protein
VSESRDNLSVGLGGGMQFYGRVFVPSLCEAGTLVGYGAPGDKLRWQVHLDGYPCDEVEWFGEHEVRPLKEGDEPLVVKPLVREETSQEHRDELTMVLGVAQRLVRDARERSEGRRGVEVHELEELIVSEGLVYELEGAIRFCGWPLLDEEK